MYFAKTSSSPLLTYCSNSFFFVSLLLFFVRATTKRFQWKTAPPGDSTTDHYFIPPTACPSTNHNLHHALRVAFSTAPEISLARARRTPPTTAPVSIHQNFSSPVIPHPPTRASCTRIVALAVAFGQPLPAFCCCHSSSLELLLNASNGERTHRATAQPTSTIYHQLHALRRIAKHTIP